MDSCERNIQQETYSIDTIILNLKKFNSIIPSIV